MSRFRFARSSRTRAAGVITVFFTLLSVLFLGLFFLLIESARDQGARTQSAHITDMAHYSAFSEYEVMLLREFDLFGVDASYGSGDFSINRLRDHLMSFMRENASPAQGIVTALCFDPWQVVPRSLSIKEYALLTDHGGEPYYQQVVTYMRKTAITQAAGKLLSVWRDAKQEEEKQEQYEKERTSADREMEELQAQEEQARQEQEDQAQLEVEEAVTPQEQQQASLSWKEQLEEARERKRRNPIPALKKLARKDLLTITCGDADISTSSVSASSLTFSRGRKKGAMTLAAKHRGLLNDLYFKEYLLDHFGDYRAVKEGAKLQYELEYILGGKHSDRDNLKETVKRLLLIREGSNYLYCVSDETMNAQATALAAFLMGWTGIPALTAIMKHALLLGWAYAESLLDVRTLMDGGKVPLAVSSDTWALSLDRLVEINELLDEKKKTGSGLDYHGYLRLLLYLQGTTAQKRRGIELTELRVRSGSGLSGFRADHLVVAVRDQTTWSIPPVFSRVTQAFMGLMGQDISLTVNGGFSYLQQ